MYAQCVLPLMAWLPLVQGAPPPDAPLVEQMQADIAALQEEVARLRAENGEDWLTEQRASEIRAMVHDVLADADTRASTLQGMTAGWDDGFFLASADGNFRLNLHGQMQVRYVFNHADGSTSGDSTRHGFENTRTKMWIDGNVVDPTWVYKVEVNFNEDGGGGFVLEDAYIAKVFDDSGWMVVAGQFKVPMLREEGVYSAYQQ
ncbi:MAG: coiled-coil domain-containing protein, partial [Planctomycetota bacterium]